VSTSSTPPQVHRHHCRRRSRGWTTRAHRHTATLRRTRQVRHVTPFVLPSVCPRAALLHLRTNGCAFVCALVPFIHATQAPPTPSRAIPQRTLTAPVRRCSRTSSQRRRVRPLPTRQATQRVDTNMGWSVVSARRPLRRAMLWWLFLPTHAPRHNQHLWTLRRMRTKARFPLRPSRTEARFPVGPLLLALVRSLVGGFPLAPIPT
jgi:hypothetical protein